MPEVYRVTTGTTQIDGRGRSHKSVTLHHGNIRITFIDSDGQNGLTDGDRVIYTNAQGQQIRNFKVDAGAVRNMINAINSSGGIDSASASVNSVRGTGQLFDPTSYEQDGAEFTIRNLGLLRNACNRVAGGSTNTTGPEGTSSPNGTNRPNGTNTTNNEPPIPANVNRADFVPLQQRYANLNKRIQCLTQAKQQIAQKMMMLQTMIPESIPNRDMLIQMAIQSELNQFIRGSGGVSLDQAEAQIGAEIDQLKADAQAKGISMETLENYTTANNGEPISGQGGGGGSTTETPSPTGTGTPDTPAPTSTPTSTPPGGGDGTPEVDPDVPTVDPDAPTATEPESFTRQDIQNLFNQLLSLNRDNPQAVKKLKEIYQTLTTARPTNPTQLKVLNEALGKLKEITEQYRDEQPNGAFGINPHQEELDKQLGYVQAAATTKPSSNDEAKYKESLGKIAEHYAACQAKLATFLEDEAPSDKCKMYEDRIKQIITDKKLTPEQKAEKLKAQAERGLPRRDDEIKAEALRQMEKADDDNWGWQAEQDQLMRYLETLPEDERAKAIAVIINEAADGSGTDEMPFKAAIYSIASKEMLKAVEAHLKTIGSAETNVLDWIKSEYNSTWGDCTDRAELLDRIRNLE